MCLDESYYGSLLFWKEEKCPDNADFKKLELSKVLYAREKNFIPGWQIHYTVSVMLDDNKQVSIVKSYQLLDLLGDIGGFTEALNIVFSYIGAYFSAQYMRASFVEKLFKGKNNKQISIPSYHILFEPLFSFISKLMVCKCCKKAKIKRN